MRIPTTILIVSFLRLVLADFHAAPFRSVTACSCSSGYIPVNVDVNIPVDPSDDKDNLINSTTLRSQKETFNVFGQLCQPVQKEPKPAALSAIQLLLHGYTYNSYYWNPQWNGFQNYSYMEFSCLNGESSFAYDDICTSRSLSPKTSFECQLPTATAVASSLARKLQDGTLASTLTGTPTRFSKVFAIGHSLGSRTLNYGAIIEGKSSPFAGIMFTGIFHVSISLPDGTPASIANPSRYGSLDSGYVTTLNGSPRSVFYGPEGTFDPIVQQLDDLTKDIGSIWIVRQALAGNVDAPSRFTGPITILIGGLDALISCPQKCDHDEVQKGEEVFFPDAHVETVVIPGQGHDLDLQFSGREVFQIMLDRFKRATMS
ncbi:hypothetical protein M422DRAFT_261367 [Sphaerobolus stellatus SS14]|uniref:AB hydrolase-1 domain-containing protein n=1 Tax=Sphaerobolus stellatus (strain SS14) TaxID=990650 RepID=A0A0C9U0D5_SPHS4|nr:hypothetical protein M422DRAFT_261367 [Sphaerobolus stellatus SS14]